MSAAPALGDTGARLMRGLDEALAAQLVGRSDDQAARLEAVITAARELSRAPDSPAARAAAVTVALAMFRDECAHLLAESEALATGAAFLGYAPREPVRPGRSPTPLHVMFPRGSAAEGGQVQWMSLHGRGFDPFADLLALERGTIPVAEYRRRMLAETRERDLAFAEDPRLDQPLTIQAVGSLGSVAAALAASGGVPLKVPPEVAGSQCCLRLAGQPLRDGLTGLAGSAGMVLQRDGPGYSLRAPETVAEQMAANAPLGWWAAAGLTRGEALETDQALVEAVWSALPAQALPMLEAAGVRLRDLAPGVRRPLVRLVEHRIGRRWRQLLAALPGPDGAVALQLFQDPSRHLFELAGPVSSMVLGGEAAWRLETELAGAPFLPAAAPAQGDGR